MRKAIPAIACTVVWVFLLVLGFWFMEKYNELTHLTVALVFAVSALGICVCEFLARMAIK